MDGDISVLAQNSPRREWLVRCYDSNLRPGVCAVEANNGEIAIAGPHDRFFTLPHSAIADFHAALSEAITQTAQDVLAANR
ncbi:hypothetical protein [Amycolatopsis sp. H20-H5]|uniref:hypothetical protein n=1 Tax=Amycolatopsis sp. H20-H5 TaxID=3046309 RepID=UPI002DBC9349|nr:hypothetical protein [Amycolatopsis sp. H20-H5]MEC3976661.1 hypothetical protein [Amycolatopsis sp. H20-H5]